MRYAALADFQKLPHDFDFDFHAASNNAVSRRLRRAAIYSRATHAAQGVNESCQVPVAGYTMALARRGRAPLQSIKDKQASTRDVGLDNRHFDRAAYIEDMASHALVGRSAGMMRYTADGRYRN